jgi:phosphatidylglycerol:prolipoprotein diacylglycerol transferase
VKEGYQTAAGFLLSDEAKNDHTVSAVEADSPAWKAGLRPGDVIVKADDRDVRSEDDLWRYLVREWPRGKNDLSLTVSRDGKEEELPAFSPKTIGLHPTQAYESISTALLLFLLLAYYPYRRHDGELLALFLILYPIHRFLNELLRSDTWDWAPYGLTLSQHGSILVFAVGVVFLLWLRRLPAQYKLA